MSLEKTSILRDFQEFPKSFILGWKINEDELRFWKHINDSPILQELATIWTTIGGGDFFETETLLVPRVGTIAKDWETIDEVSEYFLERILPQKSIILHRGLYYTIVNFEFQKIFVCLDLEFKPKYWFDTFGNWYHFLRSIYEDRYCI